MLKQRKAEDPRCAGSRQLSLRHNIVLGYIGRKKPWDYQLDKHPVDIAEVLKLAGPRAKEIVTPRRDVATAAVIAIDFISPITAAAWTALRRNGLQFRCKQSLFDLVVTAANTCRTPP